MIHNPYPTPGNRLDFRVIIEVPIRQFALWLVPVLLVTFAGYPGVVCVTPIAWLIALRVGNLCNTRTKSTLPSHRLLEAGLAGGLFGLLQGVLFAVIVPYMGTIDNERMGVVGLILIMIIAGVWVGAVLSFLTAFVNENRRGSP